MELVLTGLVVPQRFEVKGYNYSLLRPFSLADLEMYNIRLIIWKEYVRVIQQLVTAYKNTAQKAHNQMETHGFPPSKRQFDRVLEDEM